MRFRITVVLIFVVLGWFTSPVLARGGAHRIGVSFVDPIQWPDRSSSIEGIRFNFVYANHRRLTGVDLGLLVPFNHVEERVSGVQFGLYNGVDGSVGGSQLGGLNTVREDVRGFQSGLSNITYGTTRGVQFGLYNQSKHLRGVQLGLFNLTDSLEGLQIGIGNLKSEPRITFPESGPNFFPIVNWSF